MRYIKGLAEQIDRGREGKNIGLSLGMPRLEEHVYGLTQSIYTILFGKTGSGKTSIALYCYLYRPLMQAIKEGKNLKIIYFSLEMTGEMLLAKLASIHMLETYGAQIGYKEIFSKKETLNDHDYALVQEALKWLATIEPYLVIYDKSVTANTVYAFLKTFAEEEGEFIEEGNSEIYVPNNPDALRLIVMDHIGLARRMAGRTKKEEIDLVSTYLLWFRNKCRYSILVLMQVNRDQTSMDRRNANLLEPTLEDIKDSGSPSEDSEIVIGIFNPFKEKVAKHRGYNIRELRDRSRFLCLLKNRYGDVDKVVPITFYGKVNYTRELPELADEGDDSNLDYESYKNPLWIATKDQPIIERADRVMMIL
jgi:replicative DNA helicase